LVVEDREPSGALQVTRDIGARIRQAREEQGISQADLAQALGLSQAAVSNIEGGARALRVDELIGISQTLGRAVDYFLAATRRQTGPIGVTLRAQVAELPVPEYRAAVIAFLDEVEQHPLPSPRVNVDSQGTPEAVAAAVRMATGQDSIPVDVEAACRELGVGVFPRPFPESLSALVIRHDGGAVIGVNSSHAPARQRFSTAHELGHFVLHHQSQHFIEYGVPQSDQGNPPGYNWKHERAANDFAAEFLMPGETVRQDAASYSVSRLATRYRVSEPAIGFRLVNLRLSTGPRPRST
jgi:Zn-dependent peptidase ImmA (M78 family)/transcriptional regulator with XRE-family HTH domain